MNWLILPIAVAVALLAPPLMDGVRRKVYAAVQMRIGPPLLQTWYDLAKLFRRRTTVPATGNWLYYAAPLASLLCVLAAAAMASYPPLCGLLGGVIGFYLLVESSAILLVLGALGITPYTSIGGVRMLAVSGAAGLGVVMGLAGYAAVTGRLLWIGGVGAAALPAAAALIVAGIVELELPPYNVAEAGPEIAAGPYTEYQGPLLAAALMSSWSRGFTLLYAGYTLLAGPLAGLVAALATHAAYSVVAGVTGRPRPLRAVGLAGLSIAAGAAALALAA